MKRPGELPQTKQELEPPLDFKKEMLERLSRVESYPVVDQDFQKVGIEQRTKFVPAIIMDTGTYEIPNLEIWVKDFKEIPDKRYPHSYLEDELDELKEHLKFSNTSGKSWLSGYVIEDGAKNLFLFFEGISSDTPRMEIENDIQRDEWVNLLKRYELKKIIGSSSGSKKRPSEKAGDMIQMMDDDFVGKLRKEAFLHSFGEKYGMTTSQWLKFHAIVEGAREAETAIVYDEVAKEIMNEDK